MKKSILIAILSLFSFVGVFGQTYTMHTNPISPNTVCVGNQVTLEYYMTSTGTLPTPYGNYSVKFGTNATGPFTDLGTFTVTSWYTSTTPGQVSVNIPVTTNGVYYLFVRHSVGLQTGAITTIQPQVTVSVPIITATSSPVSGTVCAGTSVTLTGGGAVSSSYIWTGGVTNGTSFTPAVGTVTYTVTGTDVNGCTGTATKVITVNALPTVTATSNPTNGTVCQGGSITLTGGGASTYTWTGGVSNGVSFTPAGTLTYTVTGTAANGCTNTATKVITVNALPIVTATSSNDTVCLGTLVTLTGGGASTYSWSNGVTDGIAFTPTVTATYIVTGTAANGCIDTTSIVQNVSNCVGFKNLNSTLIIGKTYPIPANDYLNVELSNTNDNSEMLVNIYTIEGKKVQSHVLNSNDGKIVLNVSEMQSGIYLMEVISEGFKSSKKIVISH